MIELSHVLVILKKNLTQIDTPLIIKFESTGLKEELSDIRQLFCLAVNDLTLNCIGGSYLQKCNVIHPYRNV